MSKTVEERIKVLEACQKRWQECGETECAAIYQGAAFELKLYQGRIEKMESALNAAVEAMESAKRTFGHAGHWDDTMQHGKGCPICIKQTASLKAIGHALTLAKVKQLWCKIFHRKHWKPWITWYVICEKCQHIHSGH